jgi:NAD(P)-dependent dehydrogenase (short-subunit alcohol dehydrogenase family)
MGRLSGKTALVTAAGQGIGLASALAMHREGAKVIAADINATSLEHLASLGLQTRLLNVRNKAAVEDAATEIGGLDILFNCAGFVAAGTILDCDEDQWAFSMDLNMTAMYRMCKAFLPAMIAQGGGSIINTASNSGTAGDLARIAYGASKGAIITMTKYIATQHGMQNIRCNSVAPGVVLTEALSKTVPGLADIIKRHILTPEFGVPDDIAALVAFLASDESRYITGENISISGGGLSHQPHYADLMDFMAQAMK